MRVTTALNRMLRLLGASVVDVGFGAEGVIVTVRLRRRRRVCSRCGQTGRRLHVHGHRVKRWRHLDLGSSRCLTECELRRLWCPDCGAQFEAVPWARAGSRYTRDFEDVTAWLAQQMAKTPIAGLLRVAWDKVGRIVARVVADHLDERRLSALIAIGCDGISYRRGQRYPTTVVDHRAGAIVWCAPGRNAQTLQAFFDALGDERAKTIRAVSIDMSGGYEKAIRDNLPAAEICMDPFPVVRLGRRAVDQVRRDEWNADQPSHTTTGKWIKNTRWPLLKSPAKQTIPQLAPLGEVQHANRPMFRAFRSRRSCGCSTSSRTPRSPRHTSTPGLGLPIAAATVRQARPHDPPPPRRDPRRDPPWAVQRPPRGTQQPHPPHLASQLRLPLRRTPHRPRLPVLHRHCHRPPTMTFTTE